MFCLANMAATTRASGSTALTLHRIMDSTTEQRTRSVSSGLSKQLDQVRSHAKN